MRTAKDLYGGRFGLLTAIAPVDKYKNGNILWECKCDCGNIRKVTANKLLRGHTTHCGRETHPIKHGHSNERIYDIYMGIKKRCYNSNCKSYKDYGGRGIKVYNGWLDDFENFRNWALKNGYDDILTIERIDNDGNYEPSNCKWVTREEQNNNKRNNVHVMIDGEKVNLTKLAEALGLAGATIHERYHTGERGLNLICKVGYKPKKNVKIVDIDGKNYTLMELSKLTGLKYTTIKNRYYRGYRGEFLISKKEYRFTGNQYVDENRKPR